MLGFEMVASRVLELSGRRTKVFLLGAASLIFLLFLAHSVRAVWNGGDSDFRIYWLAGRAYLHGHNPYVSPAAVGHKADLFVYPAAMAAMFAPLGWLPLSVATALWALITTTAVVLALRLLGVRDSRCYAVALVSFPIASSVGVGTLTPLLLLGVAALWRWRDRRVAAVIPACLVVASELFLWPLVVWLIGTRRYRTALTATALGVAITLAAWARIGFEGLGAYPDLLHRLALFEGSGSYQPVWALPGSPALQLAVLEALAGLSAIAVFFAGRRFSDRSSFRVAVAAALAVSPILWAHYFVLLIPLLDAAFSVGWLLLLAFWISPPNAPSTTSREIVLWGVAALIVTFARATGRPRAQQWAKSPASPI